MFAIQLKSQARDLTILSDTHTCYESYGALTKVSKATATRDLQALAKAGAFIPVGSGRSARYELNID
ncbi:MULTISPECIES: hypothetical protein [unclassified Lentimonas]|uniref:hypothetical protein n=1 Tax=unclassified Lentimonas TaxID=2630993 RepID=UPI0013223D85|nr:MULTISPECIES: hypothetical protein [unclassified Lentimonas]CAA6691390.1 Unannotated [Lentimonas sp. CC10]CAA6693130.1 Unannotated [Lentimonas sp. CC19]CAA7068988.1 Unannotated [Lentimonas sp. CC11]